MKKLLAFLLLSALLCSMAAPVSAASDYLITGFVDNKTLADGYWKSGRGSVNTNREKQTVTYQETVPPGYEDYINLSTDMFEWDYDQSAPVTGDIFKASGFMASYSVTEGDAALSGVNIDSHQRRIVIRYADQLVSTEPVDFEFTVYLSTSGGRDRGRGLTFKGTLANEVVKVGSGSKIDLSGGKVAEATADIAKIRVRAGEGLSFSTSFEKGRRYYASCTAVPSSADYKKLKQNPGIDHVLTLRTAGITTSGLTVRLGQDYQKDYVYDKDLNYLGRGNEELPLRKKYYLCASKLG